MKKRSISKLFSLILALSLIVAAIPTAAASSNNIFEGIGSFETAGWHINDNSTEDYTEITDDAQRGRVISMVKGANAVVGEGFASLSTGLIGIEASQKYILSFDIKGTNSADYYITGGYFFDINGQNPVPVKLTKAAEGNVPTEWTSKSAEFTAPDNAAMVEIRIIFKGNAGDKLLLDNIKLNRCEDAANIKKVPVSLRKSTDSEVYGAWYHQVNVGTAFNDTHYIEIAEEGADDPGSIHIVNTSPEKDMQLSIRQDVQQGSYTVSMKVKGYVALADQTFHLNIGNNAVDITPSERYNDWTELKTDIEVADNPFFLNILFSQYNWKSDFYIDNIRIVNKSTGVDVLGKENGSFYVEKSGIDELYKSSLPEKYGVWYHQENVGTPFNDTHYIEIAEAGADDPGSIHIVNTSPEKDMQLGIKQDVQPGSYTVSMKVKGYVALDDQTFHLNIGNNAVDITTSTSYNDWTEIKSDIEVAEDQYYLNILFSQYNYETDFYIDNIRITNKATGENVLSSNFVTLSSTAVGEPYFDGSDVDNIAVTRLPGFTLVNNASVYSTSDAYNSNNAVKIASNTNENAYVAIKSKAVGEGDKLVISGYFKSENQAEVLIECALANGSTAVLTLSDGENTVLVDKGNGWTYFEKSAEFKNVKSARVMFGAKANGSAIFDEMSAVISCDIQAGDVNADGDINIADLIRLKKYLADSEHICISSSTAVSENAVGTAELVALVKHLLGVAAYGK